jgi:CubicO group peptidase (beta-lactamase class C family)
VHHDQRRFGHVPSAIMSALVALVALVALAVPVSAQAPPEPTPDRIDALVRAEMTNQRIPGLALAVVEGGRVTRARGYGLANVEHDVPVTAETIFQSGSVGKQFTAVAVMTLVEEGRVGLDDSIRKHFPDAPARWRDVTVRHLLTHTSGVANYTGSAVDYRRDYTEADLVRLAYTLGLDFAPGTRWSYSNTGYVLLGALVRKVSGRFYGDLLRERVFVPLGMKTARVISESDIVPHRAAGYRLGGGTLLNQEWVSPSLNTTADGALYLSLMDLVAWDRGLREGRVLRKESWDAVYAPARLRSGRTYPYGFGWSLETVGGQPVHEHGGSWQGFRTSIARYLGSDVTVIVLANAAQAQAGTIGQRVAALVDPKLARPELKPLDRTDTAGEARLRAVLADAAAGRLRRKDFVFASLVRDSALELRKLLQPLGAVKTVALLEAKELGDDHVTTWDVAFAEQTLRVELALAPDGRVANLSVEAAAR